MKGIALTLLVLVMSFEVIFCGLGALKVFLMARLKRDRHESPDILLNALGIMAFGILIDRVLGIASLFYRASPSKLESMIQIVQLHLDFGRIPEALIALALAKQAVEPNLTYTILVLTGRVASALCAGAAMWFLIYYGLPFRRKNVLPPTHNGSK